MNASYLARLRTTAALAAVTLLAAGCMAAAAGAGAAAAIHMTGNSAESQIASPVASVDVQTRAVLTEMGVQVTSRAETTQGFEYHGTSGDREVHLELRSLDGGMTQVTASVQRSPVEWDNDMARDIVRRIVARS
jgi:hypothetical protein